MLIRHLSSSRSVIVDVIRAIVSRPMSTDAVCPSRCLPHRHQLTAWNHVKGSTYRHKSRLLTTQAQPLLENRPETKKDDASDLTTNDAQGKHHKNQYSPKFIPVKRKTSDGKEFIVNGCTMKKKKKKPNTVHEYNRLIAFAIMENRINKAIKYLREMENRRVMPNTRTYTLIINGYCKQLDMTRALKWLNRMLQRKYKPDVYIYTSLIDGYMRGADIDKAEDIFRNMMKRGIKPSLVTYNVLMYNSARQLNMKSALMFWGKLLEAGLKSDVYTFAIIIHGLGLESRIDEAWKVFELMNAQNVGINEVVATTLMGMHVKHNDNEHAIELFNKFFKQNTAYRLKPTNHTRNVLLNAIISKTDVETIKKYYEEYTQSLSKPTPTESPYFLGANVYTYTSFMRAFLRHDDLSMVAKVYSDMRARNIQPTLVTYSTLMLAHAFVPDPVSCQAILEELRKGGIQLNVVLYTITMRAWAKAGSWEMVKNTYNLMKQDNIEPSKATMEVLRWARSMNDSV